jgi:PEP-CTERM motif
MNATRIKKKRRRAIGLALGRFASATFCVVLVVSSPVRAATIFTEDFESYTSGTDWADGVGTNGGWRIFSSTTPFDGGDIVTAPVFAGQNAGQVNDGGANSGHIWNRYNSTSGSNLPTDPMWIEFFVNNDFTATNQSWGLRVPTTNNIAKSRAQVGMIADNGSSGTLFVSGALLSTTFSDFTLTDGNWAHIVAEYNFNGAASTITVYARQKAAGDTSPLTTADQLLLGGSSSATFSWNGTIVDAITLFSSFSSGSPGSATFDNFAVYTNVSPIVPGGLEGDLDGDGFVGIADLNIVLGVWNQNVPPADPAADPSGDGFVGIEDLNTVLGNWNAGTPPVNVAAIPEPASLTLLGVGAVAMSHRRR